MKNFTIRLHVCLLSKHRPFTTRTLGLIINLLLLTLFLNFYSAVKQLVKLSKVTFFTVRKRCPKIQRRKLDKETRKELKTSTNKLKY